jgi:hypothetical protein
METRNHTPTISPDRDSVKDRRAARISALSLAGLCDSGRTVLKREDRAVHYFVDRYGLDEFLIFVFILICSVADAFLTIELVGGGMSEMNAVMNYYLQLGPLPFVLVKYLLTATGLTWLIIYKNYPFFRGRIRLKAIVIALAVMYSALITYEMLLLRQSGYFMTFALSMTTGLTGTF